MFGKKKTTVGLDFGSSSIKVVELAHDRSGDRLVNFGVSEPLSEAIVDGEIMDRQLVHEAIANLLESRQIRNRSVVTAVSGRAVIVKKILMDRLSEEDAKEAIQWEAEQHVPYDINDVSLDFQIINPNVDQKKMQVLLVAAKKEMIQNHADIIREAGLTPVIIDVDSFAIQNCVEANYDLRSDEVVALVNIGAEITNVNIVQDQVPHFTKDLSVGSNAFVEGIQRRYNVSQAEALKTLQEASRTSDREISSLAKFALANELAKIGNHGRWVRSGPPLTTPNRASRAAIRLLSEADSPAPWLPPPFKSFSGSGRLRP